jgi:hypothetical protein
MARTQVAITWLMVALYPGAVKARRCAPTARAARRFGLDGAGAQRNASAYVMDGSEWLTLTGNYPRSYPAVVSLVSS